MRQVIEKIRQRAEMRSQKKARILFGKERGELNCDLTFTQAVERFPSRNDLFAYMHRYFFTLLPEPLRRHRFYFAEKGRGFGEEAFHAMWYLLIREFAPSSLFEIGVFRGQVISLWALIARTIDHQMNIRCVSPFTSIGDDVSVYPDLDYLSDVLKNFAYFDLPPPDYFKGASTDAGAVAYLNGAALDCIYIDGSHEYSVVLSDYRNAVAALNPGGILVMDDSSLYTDFEPPSFSFAGHPGPSRVAREFADVELQHLAGIGHQNVYRKL